MVSRYGTAGSESRKPPWSISIRTGSALLASVFERVTRNSMWAINGVASAWTASMLTLGNRLLLVTSWSRKVSRSLPARSSRTSPDTGFV